MIKLVFEKRMVCNRPLYYPLCNYSRALAALMKVKCLSRSHIKILLMGEFVVEEREEEDGT